MSDILFLDDYIVVGYCMASLTVLVFFGVVMLALSFDGAEDEE